MTTDPDGLVLYWNAGAEELYGRPANDAVGRPLRDLVISSDAQVEAAADASARAALENDLRRAHRELQASERSYRARFEQVSLAQGVYDLQGRCTAVNDAFCALVGRERRDLLGRTAEHLHHPSDVLFGHMCATDVLEGRVEAASWERVLQRPDGTPVPVFVNATLVRGEDGEPDSMACFLQDLTQLRQAEQSLQTTVDRHHALLAHAADWVVVFDVDGLVLYASPTLRTGLGYHAEDDLGMLGWDYVHPDDEGRVRAAMERVVAEPGRSETFTLRLRTADGRWTWYEEVLSNRLDDPRVGGIVGNGRDVTERIEAELALRASEEWFRSIAVTAQEGIWVVGHDRQTLFANAKVADILGVPLADVHARSVSELLPGDASLAVVLVGAARPEGDELGYHHPDGTERRLHVTSSALERDGEAAWLLMVSDVTEVRRIEAELRHRALYDELTGLPNRTLLSDRLEQALSRLRTDRSRGPVAVLLADLDDFKLVNDTWGHAAGDQLLALVAQRLSDVVGPSHTVARFGGDEFVVVCDGLEESEVRALADRLIEAVAERMDVGGHTTYVGVSVGIAMAPADSADDLVRFADSAMYEAKSRGRNRAQMFDVTLADAAADRLVLGNDLREALAADQLQLHYQPIVALETGELLGVEALARWDHPERGAVPPERFVQVGELTGQSPVLDAWALRQACTDAARLRAGLGRDVLVSVNVSAANLGDRVLEEQLRSLRLPQGLVLEVTENTLMANPAVARAALERLRAHGVSIAIDDFGTGYSSLAYLNRLPVQQMKIDRSFVLNLTDDPDAFAITAALVDLARILGLRTVAEGVETPEQLALLRRLGCWAGQGFLWSPALPVTELVATVNRLPRGRFAVDRGAAAAAPAGRRRREPVAPEHGLAELLCLHREGASLATIAAALNVEGFRTPQGARWHRVSVARVISDRAYPQLQSAGQAAALDSGVRIP